MTGTKVTDEAVERAAKAFWEGEGGAGSPWDWAMLNELDPYKAGVYRREARVMIEAAVPHLQVQVDLITEAKAIRDEYIEGQVNRRINFREGGVTTEQVERWQAEAAEWWASRWPTLAALSTSGEGKP